jgi:predicted ATPase
MMVRFAKDDANTNISIDFEDLSDGEKCLFVCATVLAANKHYGPLFCFWDEPANYLSLSEIGYLLSTLRRSFEKKGQLVVASHNEEAIRKFSDENTFLLARRSHLEPTLVQSVARIQRSGDLITSLIHNDLGT